MTIPLFVLSVALVPHSAPTSVGRQNKHPSHQASWRVIYWSGYTFWAEDHFLSGTGRGKKKSALNLMMPETSSLSCSTIKIWICRKYCILTCTSTPCPKHSHSCALIVVMCVPNLAARPDINHSSWLSWPDCTYRGIAAKNGSTLSSWSATASSQTCWNTQSTAFKQGPPHLQ